MAALDTSTLLAVGAAGIIIFLIISVIVVLLNSLILWLITKLFKLHEKKFRIAFLAALAAYVINFVVGFVPRWLLKAIAISSEAPETRLLANSLKLLLGIALTLAVNWLVIKKFYKLETGKSFLVGLVWTVATIVVSFIVWLIIGAIILAVLLATLPASPGVV